MPSNSVLILIMCGIAGILSKEKKKFSNEINGMLNCIAHRGPDQKIIFNNNLGSFGFVRLKIIDLSDKSNQPFVSENGKVKIIYNGEIYNYKELKELYFKNFKFKSNGDGEIIMHLYLKFGISFIDKIKGMFAIAIIDENLNKVFLIRDRFGIKPLYYFYKNNELRFCSEIVGITKTSSHDFSYNIKEMYKYFNQGLMNSSDDTWFNDIKQVPLGHYIIYSKDSSLRKVKYYKIEDHIDEDLDKKKISFKNYIGEFENRLFKSYDEHNNYDVEAGVHLSGGVDSAVLAGLTKKFNLKFNSFTFDFERKEYSEAYFAKKISNSANLKNYTSILKEKNVENYLEKVLLREFEPFSSLRILSQHNLYDNYKNKTKVILDGSGGDEIGAGYSYYMIPWYLDLLGIKKKEKLKKTFFKSLPLIINSTINFSDFIKGSFNQFRKPGSATIDGSNYKNNEIFSKDFFKIDYSLNIKKPFKSNLRNAQYSDLFYLKLPRSLKYADRASMYNSIETRVPFLDHKVVEWALQLPSKFKLLNSQQRILMKYPVKNLVDKKILYLNKRTIADPQSIWLKTILKDLFFDTMNSKDFNHHGIFNKKNLMIYFEKMLKHKKHFNSFLIFQILICELWFQKIFKLRNS